MPITLGVDLGTSNAVAAVLEGGRPRIVRNQEGAPATPTVVSRSLVGEWHAGQTARRLAVMHPRETAWDFLRLLGERFDSPEVRNVSPLSPFAIVEGPRGDACLRMGGETVHHAALLAIVLAKLRAAAETETGARIEEAVVAVPASFHSGQRRLVAEAGRLSGLRTLRIHAAASVAALGPDAPDGVLAVCDLGGGGFGISLVEKRDGKAKVLARDWESFLGGEDFDLVIVRWLAEALYRAQAFDASLDPVVLAHMKEAAEKAKCRLSVLRETEVELPVPNAGIFRAVVTREEFEAMLRPQLEWLAPPCTRALKSAGLLAKDLDVVLPIGGSTRIPRVLQKITELFEKEPTLALHPEEAPAVGAAVLGESLAGRGALVAFFDVQSHELGIEYPRGSFAPVVGRNEPLPAKKTRAFSTTESRIEIHVLEGTSSLASECLSLGGVAWELPFRRSETEVTVEIEVDATGRVEAMVMEASSGFRHRITPRVGSDLSNDESERYQSEVERYLARLMAEKVNRLTSPQALEGLGTAEKVMAALNGDRRVRLRLARDPDRSVWSAVLESPKTTSLDVAAICALPDVSEDVLREIAASPEWSRHYEVLLALVTHRRTPPEVALKLVDRLRTVDLEKILADEEYPSVLRAQCRALMKMRV